MKPKALSALTIGGLVFAMGGCTTPQARLASWETDREVALAVISSAEDRQSLDSGAFRLGAGDTLGRAVYHNYIAIVRSNPRMQFASGETTNP